jgi:hypothetical protein
MAEMLPAVRAVADRLTWEGGLVRYMLEALPEEVLDRPAPSLEGWTVRQAFAHLAVAEQLHADTLERFLAGEPPRPPGFDIDAFNAETIAAQREADPQDIADQLAEARDHLFVLLERLDAGTLEQEMLPGRTVEAALARWAEHYSEHAWDIIEAVPELRFDPLLLNWLLRIDYTGHPSLAERLGDRQRQLLHDAREWVAHQEETDAS